MTEEYVYDRTRVFLVIIISAVIIGSVVIAGAVWPKEQPEITLIETSGQVINNVDQIGDLYYDFFNGTVDTQNSTLYKIDAMAGYVYFMTKLIFTLQVDQNTNIFGIVITGFYDESAIVFGQNDIPVDQKLFTRSVTVNPGDYSIFVFLDTFNDDFSVSFTVRVS